jgi:hypothetical protein
MRKRRKQDMGRDLGQQGENAAEWAPRIEPGDIAGISPERHEIVTIPL